MWMVYGCLRRYFDRIKAEIAELMELEKSKFGLKTECNSFLPKYHRCYLCEFPLEAKELNPPEKPTRDCSRLDFVIRKEHQFLKNVLQREEIVGSKHLCTLWYETLTLLFRAYKFSSRQADNPVHLDEGSKAFIVEYISDCATVEHIHKQIKECKIHRKKNATPKQKALALIYSCYIDFPGDFNTNKKCVSPSFLNDICNVFFDSHKVIHHSHVTREIYGYVHNFCNKKVREMTEKGVQYFYCVFDNCFRFHMTFLTKGLWHSLWETQDVSLIFFEILHRSSQRKVYRLC